jgi:site-specific recombinase XerD
MKLSICIHQFFDKYLPRLKGVSEQTACSYRDTFTLFLPFAASYYSITIDSLTIEHLSFDLILAFLNYLETQRNNIPRTRNQRLATLKSFAKMIRLMYPEGREIAETIINIPQMRTQKPLIGFLYPDELLKVYEGVNIKRNGGFRDYTLLHLLVDSGARASEIATLNLDYFDFQKRTLIIVGKANRYRLIELWPKTTELITTYITKYRKEPKPLFRHRLFINQRGEELTRYGVNRLCKKHLTRALPTKRFKELNPAHSFRHSCAVNMLQQGCSLTEIRNRLGHENIESTMVYLKLDLSRRRKIQKDFIEYTQSLLKFDSKIEELLDWENKEKTLDWLDSL